MMKTKLIPGFRYHPTDVELVKYYLKRKVMGKKFHDDVIAELDIYKYAPWDLPDKSCLKSGDLEWYFFCPRGKKKYANGARTSRATEVGYWKATGKERGVQHNNETVGMIRTLVFYTGRAPCGDRTDWVMYEYRLEDKDLTDKGIPQDSYVICKVFQKEGPGPRNSAQYGRPFNEKDWDDEEVEIPFAALSAPVPILPTSHISVTDDTLLSASGCIGTSSNSCLFESMSSPGSAKPSDPTGQTVNNDDDILSMLDLLPEKVEAPVQENTAEGASVSDFFEGLGDPDNRATFDDFSAGQNSECSANRMASTGDVAGFGDLELEELIDIAGYNKTLFCSGSLHNL